jgi:hypothetical protein
MSLTFGSSTFSASVPEWRKENEKENICLFCLGCAVFGLGFFKKYFL